MTKGDEINRRVAREAKLTQAYIDAHPPLITQELLDKEIFRLDMEIAALERFRNHLREAIEAKRNYIESMKPAFEKAEEAFTENPS